MTTQINNENKKLNFSNEREQSQTCLNSAEHKKNQGRKVLNVPNLRFPEFQGEWEKCKLGELTTKVGSGSTPKGGNAVYTSVGHCFVRSQNVGMGYLILDDIAHIDDDIHQKHKATELNEDDVLLNITGASIGRTAIATKEIEGGNVNQHVCIIRANSKVSPKFLCNYIQTKIIQNYIQSLQTGGSREGLNFEQIRSFPMSLPNIAEQNKIAQLLDKLNERIATQNKIIDKLQSLIKGIGKQLFMDNQNWRTVKIGELLRIGNGKDYKRLGIGKIPVYGTGGQMLLVNDYLYDGESVCIGRKGTIDTPMFLNGKFWTVDTLFYTYDFKDVLPKFCYYLFLQINWKLYNEGTGVPSLSKSTIENIKVKIPSIEQQHNICSILDCYEHKTKSEEQILELYLSEKQYLLRQMFI